jgi:phospholipid/cholesterol/gamma-HCH transport system ATP-binding protein
VNVGHLYPAEISGGMKKRVAIARAIVNQPKYLFCDEPNSGLDPKTSLVIDRLIEEITEEFKMTTIVNTHDMNTVVESGEKIIFIYKGKKWFEGSSAELIKSDIKELNEFVFASKMMRAFKAQAQQ